MLAVNFESDMVNLRLRAGAPMSDVQFFASELAEWLHGPVRREMLDGERYYRGDHDILRRRREAIGRDGNLTTVDNLPNNRIVDNVFAKHVDQKNNYLLGKPITFEGRDKEYADAVSDVLGSKFMRTLRKAGLSSLCTGIAWLYPYQSDNGLDWLSFSGSEILPFWRDAAHTELDCACRFYTVEEYTGIEKKLIHKVDIFTLDRLYSYTWDRNSLIPDRDDPERAYITDGGGREYSWDRVPLVPIKYNSEEIPLIRRAKSLQDAVNLLRSDMMNNMQENIHNTILVVKNYDGEDLGSFRQNLNTFGAVKIKTTDGVDGGVDTLEVSVDADKYKTALEMLKAALIENMRSFDGKDDRLSGNPNQMNIQSLYSDIDLDANAMESELQAAFVDILYFVSRYLAENRKTADGELNVIFNRDVLVNESQAITDCKASVGVISDETIVAQHPWVSNPAEETARLKKQREEEIDAYPAAFGGDVQ